MNWFTDLCLKIGSYIASNRWIQGIAIAIFLIWVVTRHYYDRWGRYH